MSFFQQHLAVLGLDDLPRSQEELKRVYRRQISRWHPDRYHSDEDIQRATSNSQKINVSYLWLSEYLEDSGSGQLDHTKAEQPNYTYQKTVFTPGFPDPNVFEHFVKSSHIVSIGYRSDTRVLYVKFQRTGVYRYFDVPESVFEAFLSASSPGSFRNEYVNRFRYEACKESNVPYAPDISLILSKNVEGNP